MPEIIYEVSKYLNRADLESDIKSRGQGVIKGTLRGLKNFQLSDQCKIFDCPVVCTDFPTSVLVSDRKKK